MADRVSASIAIGGTLPRSLLDELTTIITDHDLRLDWEGAPFTPDDIPADAPLELMAHEVAWGCFATLEQFCQDHGLAYARWAGGCSGSFGPERVVFTGSGLPESHCVTENDELVFDLDTIRALGSIAAIEAQATEAGFTPGPLTIVDDAPAGTAEDVAGHPVRCGRPGCGRRWSSDPALTVRCPTCDARAGIRCRRPSGHSGPFVALHAGRDLLADRQGRYGRCPLGICGAANRPAQLRLWFDRTGIATAAISTFEEVFP